MSAPRPAARGIHASSLATSPGAELVPCSSERFSAPFPLHLDRTRVRARL